MPLKSYGGKDGTSFKEQTSPAQTDVSDLEGQVSDDALNFVRNQQDPDFIFSSPDTRNFVGWQGVANAYDRDHEEGDLHF